MMLTILQETFLRLVRLGIRTSKEAKIPNGIDWEALKALADVQGLSAVVLDGLEKCHTDSTEKLPLQMKFDYPRLEHRYSGDIYIWIFDAQKEADEVLSHTDFTENLVSYFMFQVSRIRELKQKIFKYYV